MERQKNGVFYVAQAATVAMQRRGKHVSTTIEGLRFLRGPDRGVILSKTGETQARKIDMICFAKSALTAELYIVQKDEFSIACYMCDSHT
jgi:hypothetical protein